MTTYKVLWNVTTRKARIAASAAAVPTGWVSAGTFDHDSEPEPSGTREKYKYDVNHVLYHHVRDVLYGIGVLDMQRVEIKTHVAVSTVTVAPATVSVAHGATTQLTATIAPTGVDEPGLVWTTSDATKATVNTTGLVLGVAAGTATITATSKDGAHTGTSVVTVT